MNYKLRLALGCILAVSASSSYGANLLEVYQKALQSDPALREAEATRLASREARPQAWAALLPQLDGSASVSQTNGESAGGNPRLLRRDPGGNTALDLYTTGAPTETESDGRDWSIQLTQTIFSWDKWATLKRANSQVALAEATYQAAQQDMIVRVAQRYFNVLAAKDTLDANNAAAEAFSRQLEQYEKRFEVGLIAITDVQDARAARDRAAADVIGAKRALATNFELLREITGDDVSSLAEPLEDMQLKTPDPASEEQWVTTSMEQNLALVAARLNSDIADANVGRARSGHYPTLQLRATHSDSNSDTDATTSVTVSGLSGQVTVPSTTDTSSDSVSLTLSVPLFSSGATQSGVRQAVYTHRAAREKVERVSRETERGARDYYFGVMSNIARVQALKQAYESSKTALQATEAGFEVGTRTTVDVLLSRQALYTAQTQYAKSRYEYILSAIQLKQVSGTLSEKDVAEINRALK